MIGLGTVLFAPAISYSQTGSPNEAKPFLVFAGTQSPDGRYAVAWGLPKHPDVWANVCQFERAHVTGSERTDEDSKQSNEVFESVSDVAQDVENYIVDLHEGKIIRKLDCPRTPGITADRELEPEYWLAGYQPNRHDLEVVWSHGGDFVLINHTYRWDCVTFCAVSIRDGKVGPPLDVNKKLREAVCNFVARSFPRGSRYTKKDLDVSFSNVEQVSDTKFSAHAEGVVGKEWSSDGANIDFSLTLSRGSLVLTVLQVRVSE
jgi:hypothetical protein